MKDYINNLFKRVVAVDNKIYFITKKSKHVLNSANILRNFQKWNSCREITENSPNIVCPHQGVITSVEIGSVGQQSWIGTPLEIFKNTSSRGVASQFSIFFSPLFLPLVGFREEQNFRNPGMCRVSNFAIKRRSANHSRWPSSKAARKKCGSYTSLAPV